MVQKAGIAGSFQKESIMDTIVPTASEAENLRKQVSRPADTDIQVSGLRCFPESNWREAILYYLFGIWGNQGSVTYRPKIAFRSCTLRLDLEIGCYSATDHGN